MSSRLESLGARRRALIVRSDEYRAALAGEVDGFGREIAVADAVIATARRVHRNRALVGVAAVGLLLIPHGTRKLLRNFLWAAPIVVEGYRFLRATGETKRQIEAEEFPGDTKRTDALL